MDTGQRISVAATLADERTRTLTQLAALTRDFDEIVEASDLTPADDEHDPDGSTIAYERAKAAALLRQAQRNLTELDGAEARLRAGTYGRCGHCGEAISVERLQARPVTTTCVRCAELGPAPD